MDVNRISPDAEKKLIDSVQTAIGLTNDGTTPSEAISKVASDLGYGGEFATRMVEMYNTSRTLSHLKNNEGGARADDFPTAEIEKVAELMADTAPSSSEPSGEILSKAANFMGLPGDSLEKAASALAPEVPTYGRYGQPVVARAVNGELALRSRVIDARTKLAGARMEREHIFRKIATYFRTPGAMAFEDFETRVIGMHKQAGALFTDVIWDYLGNWQSREKRGAAPSAPLVTKFDTSPFSDVRDAFFATEKVAQATRDLQAVEDSGVSYRKTLHEKMAELQKIEAGTATDIPEGGRNDGTPMFIENADEDDPADPADADEVGPNEEENARDKELQVSDDGTKAASDRPFVLSSETLTKKAIGAGGFFGLEMMHRGLDKVDLFKAPATGTDQLKALKNMTATLPDQAHSSAMRALESENVLQEMMAMDPVISTYDPEEVLMAYNDISKFAPASVTQPIVLRGYLRKYLESSSDPSGKIMEGFDVNQLADVDKKLTEPLARTQIELTKILGDKMPTISASGGGS